VADPALTALRRSITRSRRSIAVSNRDFASCRLVDDFEGVLATVTLTKL
jgi:hypothetical protein